MSPRSRREYIEAIYLRYKRAESVIIDGLLFLTYYSLFRIFISSQSEFLSYVSMERMLAIARVVPVLVSHSLCSYRNSVSY
ncbi:MAG: hypothetical protein ABSB22_16170 [Thermodesulfobacteriota bacterium]|jgi:membrane protein CcdC involved in cytochrome C biogenesis